MSTIPDLNADSTVYLFDGRQQNGPMPYADLWALARSGKLPNHAFFWSPGMADWLPVSRLPVLRTPGVTASPCVLVIDDDVIMSEMISELIRQHKIEAVTADDFGPACQILEERGLDKFDAVITDFEMPGGTGVELVRWIKQRDRSLQVIMLTAQDNKEVVKLSLRSGVVDFLEKPVRKSALMNALDSAISQTLRQREERAAFMEMVRQRLVGKGVLAEQVMKELIFRESGLSNLLTKLDAISRYTAQLEQSGTSILPGSEVPQGSGPFSGVLGELSVMDILQMLIQSHKTGELKISRTDRTFVGSAYLDDGSIIHAASGPDQGHEALKSLLQCNRGYFSFDYGSEPQRRTIQAHGISSLLQVTSEIDIKKGSLVAA
ncbi:MAG: response regulator [Candidatus Methylacidiphilales bacterium]|nr:response regulator [Candidatus Methylacidiphilales bacterium]